MKFYFQWFTKNDIAQADFVDRLKEDSWEIIDNQVIYTTQFGLRYNVNPYDVSTAFFKWEIISW